MFMSDFPHESRQNEMRATLVIIVIGAILLGLSLSDMTSSRKKNREVIIGEYETSPDMHAGDRLHVRMNMSMGVARAIRECENMGGTLAVTDPAEGLCVDVDF
jgi:hypothetical protein